MGHIIIVELPALAKRYVSFIHSLPILSYSCGLGGIGEAFVGRKQACIYSPLESECCSWFGLVVNSIAGTESECARVHFH